MKNNNWHKISYNEYGTQKEMKFGDYTILVNSDNKCTPYVVAYKYNEEDGTWAQGHYFDSVYKAMEFACEQSA